MLGRWMQQMLRRLTSETLVHTLIAVCVSGNAQSIRNYSQPKTPVRSWLIKYLSHYQYLTAAAEVGHAVCTLS